MEENVRGITVSEQSQNEHPNDKLMFAVEENMIILMREYVSGKKVDPSLTPEHATKTIADILENRKQRAEWRDKENGLS